MGVSSEGATKSGLCNRRSQVRTFDCFTFETIAILDAAGVAHACTTTTHISFDRIGGRLQVNCKSTSFFFQLIGKLVQRSIVNVRIRGSHFRLNQSLARTMQSITIFKVRHVSPVARHRHPFAPIVSASSPFACFFVRPSALFPSLPLADCSTSVLHTATLERRLATTL